jgi:cyclopropane-fatty-acyl-phospholipid synthase
MSAEITAHLCRLAARPENDPQTRKLIRIGLAHRAAQLARRSAADEERFVTALAGAPIRVAAQAANRQHYEVPAAFFEQVLGRHMKYSCCLWPDDVKTLDQAEAAMLELVIARAGIEDGQRILDLGCGWGSLALELARRFPHARVDALCNSQSQRDYVAARAQRQGIDRISALAADVARWTPEGSYDRIVSIEMFEHMRNLRALLEKLERCLAAHGQLFVQVFCHARSSYLLEDDVTALNFFTGGMMPSADLLCRLGATERWLIPGTHYARTAEAWLANLDANAVAAPADVQLAMWRLFFLLTAESFAFQDGREWLVGQYLFRPAAPRPASGRR